MKYPESIFHSGNQPHGKAVKEYLMLMLVTDGGQGKIVVFRREGQGFESSHRRQTFPLGNTLLAAATFVKNDVHFDF